METLVSGLVSGIVDGVLVIAAGAVVIFVARLTGRESGLREYAWPLALGCGLVAVVIHGLFTSNFPALLIALLPLAVVTYRLGRRFQRPSPAAKQSPE